MERPVELFESTLVWLRENYGNFRFFAERDIVWTVQTHIIELVERGNLQYRILHNFPVLPRKTSDLVILGQNDSVELAAEFKYEPSHSRRFTDIWPTKLPVVFWDKDGVGKDVERIHEFVASGEAKTAYLVFIDEGGYFRWRNPHPGSKWIDWKVRSSVTDCVSVLWAQN